MNEQEIRVLIREAVARHMGQGLPTQPHLTQPYPTPPNPAQPHPSHALFAQLVNVTDACVIEPAVPCDHCGYCKSHGH